MKTIYVTNGGKEPLTSMFNSVKYTFAPGETVELPEPAARLIFGFGEKDKEPSLVRLGWMQTSKDFISAMERLMQFDLSETAPKQVHSLSPVVEQVVPLPKARGRKRLTPDA
jgi:hypothetical protein